MNLFPALEKQYTKEHQSALEAQRLAHFIAGGFSGLTPDD